MKDAKKKLMITLLSLCGLNALSAHTANLTEVLQEALRNDPVWLAATAQNLSDREGVPISLAALLPSLSLNTTGPYVTRTLASGPAAFMGNGVTRGYTINLSLSQTLFNLSSFADLSAQRALTKQSNALLNAAAEDLIIRVSQAYFQVLSDEDNLTYLRAARRAYKEQLEQVRHQYHAGLKTITDLYTAQASYASAVANVIGADNTLATDKENLRTITGKLYPTLARLREDFPQVSPQPKNLDEWVTAAGQQNWNIRAAQYAARAKKELIRKQFAGHLPSFSAEAGWENQFSRTSSPDVVGITGSNRTQNSTISLNMAFPLVEGGAVIAQTRKAQHDYEVAEQNLELALRSTLTATRQNYLNIVSCVSKIKADRSAIRSGISSLKGMRAGWQAGTEILVNVLNQQENVLRAETQYTKDRFACVNSLLALKQAAGTLGIEDIEKISRWMQDSEISAKKSH